MTTFIMTRPLQVEEKTEEEDTDSSAAAASGMQADIMRSDIVLVSSSLPHLTMTALQLQESGWQLRIEEETDTLSSTSIL